MIKDRDVGYITVIGDIFLCLALNTITIFYSAIDGSQTPRKLKVYHGIFISVIWSLFALQQTFLVDHEQGTVYITANFGFSVSSIDSSALRVLSLFICKQTLLTIIKKEECINIRCSPYIEWVD